jgi:hypothetical protein
MVLEGERSVGFSDLLGGCTRGDSQAIVELGLCHGHDVVGPINVTLGQEHWTGIAVLSKLIHIGTLKRTNLGQTLAKSKRVFAPILVTLIAFFARTWANFRRALLCSLLDEDTLCPI